MERITGITVVNTRLLSGRLIYDQEEERKNITQICLGKIGQLSYYVRFMFSYV
jgi:hypothetical protein